MASPQYRKIDAHQHFWVYDPAEYGWITDDMAAIRRDFLPEDLKPLMDGAGFDGCVAVQARQSLEETRWLLELARRHDFIRGVVGWIDLRSADVASQLRELAGNPKLVGVRHVVQDEPDDEFMLREDFRRGIARLAEFNLAYDLLIYPRQFPAAIRLVQEFPAQRFVLDHLGKPSFLGDTWSPWLPAISELAKSPNVYCKLSGMVTEPGWTFPFIIQCIDLAAGEFGLERVMIGSDWPVCTLTESYKSTMGLVEDYFLEEFPADVGRAILGGNCTRFYRLPAGT